MGRTDTNDRFLEVKGARATTVRIDVKTLIGAAADQPLRVFLRPTVPVAGLVVDTGGAPVEGALVSLFELIRSRPPTGEALGDEIVTKRWIAETTSDPSGRFLLNGPPPGEYEFLAAHPTRGRSVGERQVDGTPITLRLRPTPRVRGGCFGTTFRWLESPYGLFRTSWCSREPPTRSRCWPRGTVTDGNGEFELSLPEQGSGDVVIGGGGLATARHRYADADSLPAVTDLGDIVLPAPTRLTVRLPRGDCELVAVGPIGSQKVWAASARRSIYVMTPIDSSSQRQDSGGWRRYVTESRGHLCLRPFESTARPQAKRSRRPSRRPETLHTSVVRRSSS